MKTSTSRLLLFGLFGFVLLAAGFVLGGVYASSRAVATGHTASLIYFTAIHQAIEEQNYDKAAKLAATAVDSHVAVVREVDARPWVCLGYVLPWLRQRDAERISGILAHTKDHFATQQEQLLPETRAYLASHP